MIKLYGVTRIHPPKNFYTEVYASTEEEAIEKAKEYDEEEWEMNPNDENLEPDYIADKL